MDKPRREKVQVDLRAAIRVMIDERVDGQILRE